MRCGLRKFTQTTCFCLAAGVWLLIPAAVGAQSVIATAPVGTNPTAIAVNQASNKIYVANCPTTTNSQPGVQGSVTVMDGDTNATATVPAGICPVAIQVNSVTNKIYVANYGKTCLIANSCNNAGNITVIDGATNSTVEVDLPQPNLPHPRGIAIDINRNKIYVTNHFSSDVAVIDGSTNTVSTLLTAALPYEIAANLLTNKFYLTSFDASTVSTGATVTVIDGATNATLPIIDPGAAGSIAVAVNPVTNRIYVANLGDVGKNGTNIGSITVIEGASNSTSNIVAPNAFGPHAVAVNPLSNKVYIANANNLARTGNGGVTVIDGETNAVVTVSDPNAQTSCNPFSTGILAVDSTRNLIYVANCEGSTVSIIDGATNAVASVTDSNAVHPVAIAINLGTNKIYVANSASNNVSVIAGGVGVPKFTLSVTKAGSGSGSVVSKDGAINCSDASGTCSATYPKGSSIVLSAAPNSGSTFSAWSGACAGADAETCNVTLDSDLSVNATFSGAPDFSVTVAGSSLSLKRGEESSVQLSFPAQGGFSGTIALTCSVTGPAPMPTCGLSPNSVTPGNSATLTVDARQLIATQRPVDPFAGVERLYAGGLPFALAGCVLAASLDKKRRRNWLLGSILLGLSLPAACSGGSNPPPAQNFTITVTASSGALQHTSNVTVTVH